MIITVDATLKHRVFAKNVQQHVLKIRRNEQKLGVHISFVYVIIVTLRKMHGLQKFDSTLEWARRKYFYQY